MKKLLTTILCLCAFGCATAAVACGETGDGSSTDSSVGSSVVIPSLGEKRAVTFEKGVGFTPKSNVIVGSDKSTYLYEGTMLTFTLQLGAFYAGNPIAYVNDEAVVADAEGQYKYAVGSEDIVVRIEGVRKDVSNMDGSGTMEDAWVVRRPIDLLYIAEQVNKGVESYCQGAYVLANDIDCQGEELKVIGDYSTSQSVFTGSFACSTNPDTGETERHVISNFVINSTSSNYVGLFGAVFASTAEGSAQFYGIGVDNFTINASTQDVKGTNTSISCGGLIGYGVGARLFLCDATNGEVFVYADNDYFSFAGGLIGYQQGYYDANYGMTYPTEIAYATVSTNVYTTGGTSLYAGGIAGFMTTNYPYGATASIHNSYALGDVGGALRSGGIAGGMGQYSSVSNCYAAGEISAISTQSHTSSIITTDDYCHAYAGGVVGFAENDTVAHDSFYAGNGVSASTASPEATYAHANKLVGGGDEAGAVLVDSKKYVVIDCLDTFDLTDKNYFKDNLSWQPYDWKFAVGELPTINYESATDAIILDMTVVYTLPGSEEEIKVGGEAYWKETYFNSTTQSNSYSPIGAFVMGDNNLPILAQTYKSETGLLSYGFFFDRDCQHPVPASYIPTKNITFYVAFADPTPLIGEQTTETVYNMADGDGYSNLTLTFKKDGTLLYSDGVTEAKASYTFDGENILIKDARLARYYQGSVVIDEYDTTRYQDANFDLYRYSSYNFAGKIEEGKIKLWDGVYFTQEAPLVYGVGSASENQNKFLGSWVAKATREKTYTFNQDATWSYVYYGRSENGTYEVSGNELRLSNGKTASFNSDGFLELGSELFYAKDSYVGTWLGSNYELILLGIRENGVGNAQIKDSDGYINEFFYEISETNTRDGVIVLYYPTYDNDGNANAPKDLFYGYATYDKATRTLRLVQPNGDAETGFAADSLKLYDDYYGDWVSSLDTLVGVDFSFNGLGMYANGQVTISNGSATEKTPYSITITDDGPEGAFTYGTTQYKVVYNEATNELEIKTTAGTLERKDELAAYDFVDMNGVIYRFDGRSTLGEGTLTYGENAYTYQAAANGFDVFDGANKIGNVVKADSHYLLTVNEVETELYLSNKFMGDWAISGEYALFKIGPTDLNGVIKANFKNTSVDLKFLNSQILTFYYRDYEQNGLPYTYYVFITSNSVSGDQILALSEFPYLINGMYTVCTKKNELFGTWESSKFTLRFDGTTMFPSYGFAELSAKLEFAEASTPYLYMVHEKGMLMWSQDVLAGRTWYYRIDLVSKAEAAGREYFEQVGGSDKVLIRTEVDSLYLTTATDENKNTYFFDYDLTTKTAIIAKNGEKTYTYVVKSYNTDNTITLEVTEIASGDKYAATFNRTDTTFTLGEQIVEDAPAQA